MQKEMENTPPECRRMREEDTHILQSRLSAYAGEGMYPFHMPGHKRRMQPAPGLPFAWDLTEVPGTDDLHDAAGILKEAMERTADQCGADRTWYLVNGSTCGLLAGIRALAAGGSHVLCARNCHKAVYHALELSGYHVHWIVPPVDPDWGICGGISAVQVAAALRRHPSVKAVILTSPTYEGVLSDIEGICSVCHARDIPVLVDEAHGAHLMPLSRRAGFPAGALECGADVVVQSPHKTLPSLTQTALLHLQGSRVDPRRIEDELDIFDREAFRNNPLQFYVGATDVQTGKPVYHLCTDGGTEDMLWFRASASMPMVSRPVKINDLLLLDGGITDAVPYAYMEKQGYCRNVIVLTQPKGYRKEPTSGIAMMKIMLRKYPCITDAMAIRHQMYNRQMDEIDGREASGESLVIRIA